MITIELVHTHEFLATYVNENVICTKYRRRYRELATCLIPETNDVFDHNAILNGLIRKHAKSILKMLCIFFYSTLLENM